MVYTSKSNIMCLVLRTLKCLGKYSHFELVGLLMGCELLLSKIDIMRLW